MNQQNPSNPGNPGNPNNSGGANRRPQNNNRRRPHHNNNPDRANRGPNPNPNPNASKEAHAGGGPRPQGQGQGQPGGGGGNNNRRRHNNNRNRPHGQNRPQQSSGQNTGGFSLDRIYEKYLNLLDQHLIARRKYHDLFYRAEPAQKVKLEKNFYNTLNDIRDFEDRLAPDVKDLFEKRNNGYQYDRTYTSNHEIPIEGDVVPGDLPPAEPHFLQSQIQADFQGDTEESVGTLDDYLKYKNLL